MSKVTISAVVTGYPAQLRKPKPLPGETLGQFVIRNHPQEWRNCIDRIDREFGATKEVCERLRRGILDVKEEKIHSEIERFMNHRLPSIGRTLESVAELRDEFGEPPISMLGDISIVEILLPKTRSQLNDEETIKVCRLYGAKLIWLNPGEEQTFFIKKVLPEIQGDFVWVLPGGTHFIAPMTGMIIARVMGFFTEWSDLAVFSDNTFSTIYRTEAVRDVINRAHTWPDDVREQGLLCQKFGYQARAKEMPLVELEAIYGGPPRPTDDVARSLPKTLAKRPLWRRIFGG